MNSPVVASDVFVNVVCDVVSVPRSPIPVRVVPLLTVVQVLTVSKLEDIVELVEGVGLVVVLGETELCRGKSSDA